MVKKVVSLLFSVFLPTLLVVKLARSLFDAQIRWLYIVAGAIVVVGAVVMVIMRSRVPETGEQ